jgi:hypothetical protein
MSTSAPWAAGRTSAVVSPNGVYKELLRHRLNTRAKRPTLVAGCRVPAEPPWEGAAGATHRVLATGRTGRRRLRFVGRLRGTSGTVGRHGDPAHCGTGIAYTGPQSKADSPAPRRSPAGDGQEVAGVSLATDSTRAHDHSGGKTDQRGAAAARAGG